MARVTDELAVLRAHLAEYLLLTSPRRGAIHEQKRTLQERAFYPAHAPRTGSSAYRRVRRAMVHDEDQPCRICGVRTSTLDREEANVFRARQLEVHHHTIEWAFGNAIDSARFQACIVAPRVDANPARYGRIVAGRLVPRVFTKAERLAWIDHDRDNLWIVCDVHHRHRWFGVHTITGPVWEAQRLLRDELARAALRPTG